MSYSEWRITTVVLRRELLLHWKFPFELLPEDTHYFICITRTWVRLSFLLCFSSYCFLPLQTRCRSRYKKWNRVPLRRIEESCAMSTTSQLPQYSSLLYWTFVFIVECYIYTDEFGHPRPQSCPFQIFFSFLPSKHIWMWSNTQVEIGMLLSSLLLGWILHPGK